MRTSDLSRTMAIFALANVPLMVTSEPGSGKTSICRQVAKGLNYNFIARTISGMDDLEARGLPYIDKKFTYQAPTGWLMPKQPRNIILLDEFTKGRASVQNQFSEAICEGTVDQTPLPPQTTFFLTGNLKAHRAGEQPMPTHLRNRMGHIVAEANSDDWVKAAYNGFSEPPDLSGLEALPPLAAIDAVIIAFLRFRPALISKFTFDEDAFPTPRTYGLLNRVLPYILQPSNEHLQKEVIDSIIGVGAGIEFLGFLRQIAGMFDVNLCFTNPETAPVPENPSVLYAVITALAARVTKKNANNLYKYLGRIAEDMAATCVHDFLGRDNLLGQCPEGIKWTTKNFDLLVG